ncbi:MAG TPA: Ig-like domain-containing protein [Longimicrobiaceae bacterium]|nr:Ig-like domain-containing protein [Longimicrobiaceae bacterium]
MRTQRTGWKRGAGWMAVLTLLVMAAACDGEGPVGPTPGTGGQQGPKPVASVVVSPDTIILQARETRMLSATLQAADRTPLADRTVEWATSDSAVAYVTQNGIVVATGVGTVTVTATSEGKQGQARVEVAPPPPPPSVAYVRVTPGEVNLLEQPTPWKLSARTYAANGQELGRPVAWTSGDSTRLRVMDDGTLLVYGSGTVYVTATSEGKQAQAKVVIPEWQKARRLTGAAGLPLPALIGTDSYVDDRGATHTVRRVVTDGALRQSFTGGRYEQRLTVQTYQDGVLVGTQSYTDRGTVMYDMWWGTPVFTSTLFAGLTFRSELQADGALAVTQRIGGEGAPATFVYAKP